MSIFPAQLQPGGTFIIGNSAIIIAPSLGRSSVALVRRNYVSLPVPTGLYTELVTSLPAASNEQFIFDSSGRTLKLAVGASGSEIDQYYITPGGNGEMHLAIPNASRISIKALGSTASTGELNITFFG